MADENTLIKKVSEFVSKLFKDNLPKNYIYHNYSHTVEIVEACKEIGKGNKLNETELEIVLLAAWFHDTGYTDKYDGHEEVSKAIAKNFLMENDYPQEKIEQVIGCIHATELTQIPQYKLEEVICDAEMIKLGTKSYFEKSERLRSEWETARGKIYSEEDWLKFEIDFLSNRKYYTPFAKKNYDKKKSKNISKLKKQLEKMKKNNKDVAPSIQNKEKNINAKKESPEKSGRGIETMFRTTSRNHIALSGMADNKANIMLSINAIIVSFTVSFLVPNFDDNPKLIIPSLILMLVCISTIIFAILSTIPKVTKGTFTKEDIKNKKSNLLFFGNFYKMKLEDFEWGMNEMMKDKDFLYGSMMKDLYYLGKVLANKYKYLRICYNIFMFGLILSILTFVVAIASAD